MSFIQDGICFPRCFQILLFHFHYGKRVCLYACILVYFENRQLVLAALLKKTHLVIIIQALLVINLQLAQFAEQLREHLQITIIRTVLALFAVKMTPIMQHLIIVIKMVTLGKSLIQLPSLNGAERCT